MGRRTFGCEIQKAVLVPFGLLFAGMVVLSVVLPRWARNESLAISAPTTFDIALSEMQTRVAGVGQELNDQIRESKQHMALAVGMVSQAALVKRRRLSQRVWAQTNGEANVVPAVDTGGLGMVGAFFQLNMSSYAQLDAHPFVNETENSVMVMRPLIGATDDILQMYIAHDDDLIFWLERTYRRSDNYRTSPFLNGCTHRYEIGYKPHCDPWFLLARDTPGRVAVVPPYVDGDTGDLTITFAQTLPNMNHPVTGGAAVLGLDRDMTSMKDAVEQASVGGMSGRNPDTIINVGNAKEYPYSVLVHRSSRVVIRHPLYTNTSQLRTIDDLESETNVDWEYTLSTWVNTAKGPLLFTRGSNEWYLACAVVAEANWVVCVLSPKSVASAVGDRLSWASDVLLIVSCCVMVPITVALMAVMHRFNDTITRPILLRLKSFTAGLQSILSPDRTALVQPPTSVPIRRPNHVIPPAVDLRSTQLACYQLTGGLRVNGLNLDSADKAAGNYDIVTEAAQIFRDAKNQRAHGVALSLQSQLVDTLASQRPDYKADDAVALCKQALEVATALADEKGENQVSDRAAAATRLMKLGNLLQKSGDFKSAQEAYNESYRTHSAMDNIPGVVLVSINQAGAAIREGELSGAPVRRLSSPVVDHKNDHDHKTPITVNQQIAIMNPLPAPAAGITYGMARGFSGSGNLPGSVEMSTMSSVPTVDGQIGTAMVHPVVLTSAPTTYFLVAPPAIATAPPQYEEDAPPPPYAPVP